MARVIILMMDSFGVGGAKDAAAFGDEGADTFFPDISPEQWKEVSRSDRMTDEKSGLEFEFVTYIKRI